MSASGTPRLALLALAALSLIWGYNWVVMKQVIQYVDPFDFSAIRTVLGAVTLFLVLLVLRKPFSNELLPDAVGVALNRRPRHAG